MEETQGGSTLENERAGRLLPLQRIEDARLEILAQNILPLPGIGAPHQAQGVVLHSGS